MIEILGRANSVNVQKVTWCAAELGLDVERKDIGGQFGGNDTADYLEKNPNGRIPTLIDNGFVLWESNSIVRYLCQTYGRESWQPTDPKVAALANQWMDWYLTTLHAPMTTLFWGLIRTAPEDQDWTAINKAAEDSAQIWSILDSHLADREFVTGGELTMGDIPVGCAAYRWHCMDFQRPELPNLERWWDRLNVRPAYREHVMLPLT